MPKGYFNQTVASFNPWSNQHFIVKKLTQRLTPNEDILLKEGKQELIIEEEQEFEYLGYEEEHDFEEELDNEFPIVSKEDIFNNIDSRK